MVERSGALPAEWKGKYDEDYGKAENSWYDQNRRSKLRHTFSDFLDERRPSICKAEKAYVLAVIGKVLQPLPEQRLTASQLLQDADFKGLMSFYGQ